MKVKDAQFFTVVSSFLNVYLVKNRSCSSNTVKSYEDALNLLFTFLEGTKDIPRQRVNWSHFTRQNIQEFVYWLEKVRNCRSTMPPYRTKERIAASLCSCVCLLQFRTFSSQSINSCMFWRVKWLQFARCLGIAFAVSRKVKNRFRASS